MGRPIYVPQELDENNNSPSFDLGKPVAVTIFSACSFSLSRVVDAAQYMRSSMQQQ